MERKKSIFNLRVIILLILAIFVTYLSLSGMLFYFSYKKNLVKYEFLKEKIAKNDFSYLYNMYFSQKPKIESRPFYGDPNATLTLIAFLDFTAKGSRYFINEIFPKIRSELINNKKIKYYHGNYLTFNDYTAKNDRYIYAKALLCMQKINPREYYEFYFDLFNIPDVNGVVTLMEKFNISKEIAADCIHNKEFEELKESAAEVENFRIDSIKQRFYIGLKGTNNIILDGVPSYDKFKRIIRESQIGIGD